MKWVVPIISISLIVIIIIIIISVRKKKKDSPEDKPVNKPQNCSYGRWSKFSPCSQVCEKYNNNLTSSSCPIDPKDCPNGNLNKDGTVCTRHCEVDIDCKYHYTDWSDCPSCGVSQQSCRNIIIDQKSKGKGLPCPTHIQECKDCQIDPCSCSRDPPKDLGCSIGGGYQGSKYYKAMCDTGHHNQWYCRQVCPPSPDQHFCKDKPNMKAVCDASTNYQWICKEQNQTDLCGTTSKPDCDGAFCWPNPKTGWSWTCPKDLTADEVRALHSWSNPIDYVDVDTNDIHHITCVDTRQDSISGRIECNRPIAPTIDINCTDNNSTFDNLYSGIMNIINNPAGNLFRDKDGKIKFKSGPKESTHSEPVVWDTFKDDFMYEDRPYFLSQAKGDYNIIDKYCERTLDTCSNKGIPIPSDNNDNPNEQLCVCDPYRAEGDKCTLNITSRPVITFYYELNFTGKSKKIILKANDPLVYITDFQSPTEPYYELEKMNQTELIGIYRGYKSLKIEIGDYKGKLYLETIWNRVHQGGEIKYKCYFNQIQLEKNSQFKLKDILSWVKENTDIPVDKLDPPFVQDYISMRLRTTNIKSDRQNQYCNFEFKNSEEKNKSSFSFDWNPNIFRLVKGIPKELSCRDVCTFDYTGELKNQGWEGAQYYGENTVNKKKVCICMKDDKYNLFSHQFKKDNFESVDNFGFNTCKDVCYEDADRTLTKKGWKGGKCYGSFDKVKGIWNMDCEQKGEKCGCIRNDKVPFPYFKPGPPLVKFYFKDGSNTGVLSKPKAILLMDKNVSNTNEYASEILIDFGVHKRLKFHFYYAILETFSHFPFMITKEYYEYPIIDNTNVHIKDLFKFAIDSFESFGKLRLTCDKSYKCRINIGNGTLHSLYLSDWEFLD